MIVRMHGLVLVLAMAAACGGSASTDASCAALAQARCTKRASCTNGTGITRVWGDMNTCLTREKLSCQLGLAAPSTANSPALVTECVSALASFACADFLDGNLPTQCMPTGPKPNGSSCAFAGQCSSTYCNGSKTAACGTCGAAPAAGMSCRDSFCARGQECMPASLVCEDFVATAGACNFTTNPCGAGLSCVGAMGGAMGSCMTAVMMPGSPCGGRTASCDGQLGLYCGGTAGARTCLAISFVADGQPCGLLTGGTFAGCSGSGGCYTATGLAGPGQAGTCRAPAADGMACDSVTGPPCLGPARCVVAGGGTAGTCTLPTGMTCM
jgi:hypothetical protein